MTGSPDQRHPGLGFALIVLAAVVWGGGGVAASIVGTNSQMSYPAINGVRQLGGGLIVLAIVAATGELRRVPRTREAARHILVTGLLTAGLGGFFFQSLPYLGVAAATVVSIGTAPVCVALHTAITTRRWPPTAVTAALIAALAGLMLVSGGSGSTAATPRDALIGLGLALTSGVLFAAVTITNRQVVAGLSVRSLIATSFTVSGVIATLWGFGTGMHLETLTPQAWLGLAYATVVHTALGFMLYYGGLRLGVPATSAAILTLLEPLTAAVLAVLILAEPLSLRGSLGIALILLGVVLVRPRRVVPH